MKPEFKDEYTKLGIRIATIRRSKNLTQKEVGDRMNVDSQHISKFERGSVGMTLDKLFALSKALGISSKELLDFDDIEKFM